MKSLRELVRTRAQWDKEFFLNFAQVSQHPKFCFNRATRLKRNSDERVLLLCVRVSETTVPSCAQLAMEANG